MKPYSWSNLFFFLLVTVFTAYYNCTSRKIGLATVNVSIFVTMVNSSSMLSTRLTVKKFCKQWHHRSDKKLCYAQIFLGDCCTEESENSLNSATLYASIAVVLLLIIIVIASVMGFQCVRQIMHHRKEQRELADDE